MHTYNSNYHFEKKKTRAFFQWQRKPKKSLGYESDTPYVYGQTIYHNYTIIILMIATCWKKSRTAFYVSDNGDLF